MPTNVSYASTETVLEGLIMHTLPDFGPDGASGIINNNLLLSFLKAKKRFDVVDGGLEFWSPIIKSRNSNLKWQSHEADMAAQLQDPTLRLRYPIETYAGAAIVINKKHEAMNKGRAMIRTWAKTLRDQAEQTIPNDFNSAFWKGTPATSEPNSIPSLISITPTTGTIGGVNRAGRIYLQNGHSATAITDIGAEAGLKAIKGGAIRQAITSRDMIDLVIMGDDNYAAVNAFLDERRRYQPGTTLADTDFETIKMGKIEIGFENTNVMNNEDTIPANYMYGINSNWMKFKVLKDGNFIFNPDGFERIGKSMNRGLYFWVFCNLCDHLPRAHMVWSSVANS